MYSKRRLQYFQKENYIELKTLEYYLWWDTKLAKDLFLLRHELNSLWFEKYIKFRLKKLWYKMKNNTGWNKADWWIDLKGSYNDIPVYIQCKKYIKNSTYKWISRISDIRNFHSWVIDDFGLELDLNAAVLCVKTFFFLAVVELVSLIPVLANPHTTAFATVNRYWLGDWVWLKFDNNIYVLALHTFWWFGFLVCPLVIQLIINCKQ